MDMPEVRRLDSYTSTMTVAQLFLSRSIRKPLMVVCFAMLSQQVSGPCLRPFMVPSLIQTQVLMQVRIFCHCDISIQLLAEVLYYSNEILSISLPEWGPYVSLGITIVNVIMTFPPIILIEVSSY